LPGAETVHKLPRGFREAPLPHFRQLALGTGRDNMSKPVAKELDEEEALREAIDALRADNGRLLRLLIAGFVSDGRPEHKELTEVLAHHPNLRNWLGTGELRILDANQSQVTQRQNNDQSSAGQTTVKGRHRRGRRGKPKKK
jgi:hypothetical protein